MKELSEAARAARREYQRQYRAKNADKLREYNKAYREANRDKQREYERTFWERKAKESSIDHKILMLHEQGLSLRDIADKIGINHMKVSRIIKRVTGS